MVGGVGKAEPQKYGTGKDNGWEKSEDKRDQEVTSKDDKVDGCETFPNWLGKVLLQEIEIGHAPE